MGLEKEYIREVTFLFAKQNEKDEVDYEALGLPRPIQTDTEFTEHLGYIDIRSIHSINDGIYTGTSDIHYGALDGVVCIKGSLEENYKKLSY